LKSQQQDLKQPLKITFNEPLKTIDSNAIRLQEDTLHRNVTYSWEKDTSGKGILLHYDWKEDTRYRLLLDSAFAVDTSGLAYAKKDTVTFQSKSKADYGKLILHFNVAGQAKEAIAPERDSAEAKKDSLVADTLLNRDTSDFQLVVELYKDKKMN